MNEIELNEEENISNNNIDKSKAKPIIKCIFCEKLETAFSRSHKEQIIKQKDSKEIINNKSNNNNISKNKNSEKNNNNKIFIKSKQSIESKDKKNNDIKEGNKKKIKLKKVKKSISAINIINKNNKNEDKKISANEQGSEEDSKIEYKKISKKTKNKNISSKKLKKINKNEDSESPDNSGVEAEPNGNGIKSEEEEEEPEPDYEEDQNISELPVMLTNLNNTYDKYYKNFDICGHSICFNCIARLIFTSHLNELPSYEDIKINCKCNMGSIQISINDLEKITSKLNFPEEEKICDNHGLIQIKFCLECKKWLCKKCIESHFDLFGEKLHHLEDESPPHNDLCKDHPTCFLDTLCNDCHKTICHLCLVEGNKHYCHNAVSFNSMKINIIKNVENMKFSNYDLFLKGIDDLNNIYENLYNEEIKKFTDQIDTLIENINEYKEQFLSKMKIKFEQKDLTIKIIKNIYEFFFKEYATIPKSTDYPVLCLYQVFNSEFISFRLDIPEIKNSFISQISESVSSIDNSDYFQNKYQFSLKNYYQTQSIINHTDAINSICCLEDGRIVTGGEDKKILIWSKLFDKIDLALLDNPKPIKIVKTLNDGRLIVGSYQTLKIYNNANNFKVSCILKDISNNVLDLINLDDGRIICGSYREIKIFNMTWNSLYKDGKAIKEHSSWVTSLIKLNGKRFASGSEDKQILIFDYNMKLLRRIVNKFPISCLCNKFNNNIIYDEDNYNNFFIGDYDGRIYLYKFTSQNIITVSEIGQHNSKINSIIPLFGGNYCSIAQESKIIIHDGDFNPIQTLNNNDKNKSVNSVVQLYDGKLISGNQLGGINIYE